MKTLFSQIIDGEIPCYRIYEDERTFVFLDINPITPGHALVVSKNPVSCFYDLPIEDYNALFDTVRKMAPRLRDAFGTSRSAIIIAGFEVPHTHVHIIPTDSTESLSLANAKPAKDSELLDAYNKILSF
jgi:histidine triad (HIT) family protein